MSRPRVEPLGEVHVPDVADLEKRLAEFWKKASTGEHAVVRACSLNLVVTCRDEADRLEVTRTLALLSERHPARALVVAVEPAAGRPRLEAYVSAHCHRGAGGAQVCSEQVTLEARGEAVRLVPETVLQLLVEEIPVYVWWRRKRLRSDRLWEALAGVSDRLIVDSCSFSDPSEALAGLHSLLSDRSRRPSVGDLVWVRLEAWREMVAGLFDPLICRPFLDGITGLEVRAGGPGGRGGVTVAGCYLGGWLASRLGWREVRGGAWQRADGTEVSIRAGHDDRFEPGRTASIRIEATAGGRDAVFVLERTGPDSDAVRARMETEGACPLPFTRRLARRSEARLLVGELERAAYDPVFEAALEAATRLAGGPVQ